MRDRMSVFGINMARRSNRRWLVAATYLSLLGMWAFIEKQGGTNGIPLILMATILNGLILGGYGRRGLIKPFITCTPFGSPAPSHNDERDLQRRDRVHFNVYRFVVALALLGYALGGRPFQQDPQLGRTVVLFAVILGLTLPQALLLWNEPDVEQEEPPALHAPDPVR